MGLLTAMALLAATPQTEDLAGTWDVSLYFSENAAPSATVMVIDRVEDDALTGTFYNSPFLKARARLFKQYDFL